MPSPVGGRTRKPVGYRRHEHFTWLVRPVKSDYSRSRLDSSLRWNDGNGVHPTPARPHPSPLPPFGEGMKQPERCFGFAQHDSPRPAGHPHPPLARPPLDSSLRWNDGDGFTLTRRCAATSPLKGEVCSGPASLPPPRALPCACARLRRASGFPLCAGMTRMALGGPACAGTTGCDTGYLRGRRGWM